MIWRQSVIIGTLLLLAVIIQVTLLSRLGLPGATPDLVVVTVVAIAFAMGPLQGAAAGFAGGFFIGIAPPADSLIGVNAAVYVTIGVIAGLVVHPRDRSVAVMVGIVGLSAAGSVIATAALDAILGSPRVVWEYIPGLALSSALYAVILAPLVILGVGWLTKQLAPEIAPP